MVAGPRAHICNECVGLCNKIMDVPSEGASPEGTGATGQSPTWNVLSPTNPTAVALRTVQRQVAQVARQLANLVDAMESAPDSDGG